MDPGQIRAEAVCGPAASSHPQRGAGHHTIWPSAFCCDGAQPAQTAPPLGPLHQGGHQRSPF